mmetsp:Transcript_12215/g.19537  ORF Transcript_12215/g.19537 Transcript_12215/m.19537 type:complete len:87 (+) Transcript_12215:834-1094(+)
MSNGQTDVGSGFDSAAKAADTPVYLATAPAKQLGTGKFWQERQAVKCSFSSDSKTGEALWDYCAKMQEKLLPSVESENEVCDDSNA